MDIDQTKSIIRALAEGADPITGEELPKDGPYQRPEVIRALFAALAVLEKAPAPKTKRQGLPANAGQSWSANEDARLAAAFDSGKTIKELADTHQRTRGAISSRLIKMGKIKIDGAATGNGNS